LSEGHIYVEPLAHKIVPIEGFDRVLSIPLVLVFNEPETGLQIHTLDFAVFAKEIVHVSFAHLVGYAADVKFRHGC